MPIGIYCHVPFCITKCPYCDFYSLTDCGDTEKDAYTDALTHALREWGDRLHETADTLYFGGGTPSLLGGKRLATLINTVREAFSLTESAEVTMEANPGDGLDDCFRAFSAAGGSRVSLGLQAVGNNRLHQLGRRHTVRQAEEAIIAAHRAGIANCSLDLMLGIPEQTEEDVRTAAARCADWGATHVSAYLLKIEPGTPYAANPPALPDDQQTADLYRTAVYALEEKGFNQYEISNFAHHGQVSRHNLKYWDLQPYLGVGPSAHSFLSGKRFAYSSSLSSFLLGLPPIPESDGTETIAENSPEEYAMLRLRLTEGLTDSGYQSRFGAPIPQKWKQRAAALPRSLVSCTENWIRLTPEGFLVSSSILSQLLL